MRVCWLTLPCQRDSQLNTAKRWGREAEACSHNAKSVALESSDSGIERHRILFQELVQKLQSGEQDNDEKRTPGVYEILFQK